MRIVPFAVLALAFAGPSGGQPPKKTEPTPDSKLKQVEADLKEARELLKKLGGPRDVKDKLELLVTRSELAVAEVRKEVAATARPVGMAAADFDKVLAGLKKESFDDNKLTFVKGLGKAPRFTSAQVKQLLAAFSFDTRRADAAVLLHPQVIDPEQFFQALEAFSFESSKRDVRERIGMR